MDPGATGDSWRFYVDSKTGMMFKEGTSQQGYVDQRDYEVTQVRKANGKE